MTRYTSEWCNDCGQGLTWIEIAFGRVADPVCGPCLQVRRDERPEVDTSDSEQGPTPSCPRTS